MAGSALRPIHMRARLEDVFADAERSGFGLALDARIQRKFDNLLLEGKRCVGDSDRERPEFEVRKKPDRNDSDAEEKTEKVRGKGRCKRRRMF